MVSTRSTLVRERCAESTSGIRFDLPVDGGARAAQSATLSNTASGLSSGDRLSCAETCACGGLGGRTTVAVAAAAAAAVATAVGAGASIREDAQLEIVGVEEGTVAYAIVAVAAAARVEPRPWAARACGARSGCCGSRERDCDCDCDCDCERRGLFGCG